MDNPYLFDILQISPPEVAFKMTEDDEDTIVIRPIFTVEDATRFMQIVERRRVESVYMEKIQTLIQGWEEASNLATAEGREAPEMPQLTTAEEEKNRYSIDDMQKDIFVLLRDIWRKSEKRKPKHERLDVQIKDLESRLSFTDAWQILQVLWNNRFAQRVAARSSEQPATVSNFEAEKEVSTPASAPAPTTTLKRKMKPVVNSAA